MSEDFENPVRVPFPDDDAPKRSFSPALRKLAEKRIEQEAQKLFEEKISDAVAFEFAVADASTPAKKSVGRPKKPKTNATADDWNSPLACKPDEATSLLKQSGIESPAVIKVLVREIPVLCQNRDLLPNRFVWLNGIKAAEAERNKSRNIGPPQMGILTREEFEKYAAEHPFLNYDELSRLYELCAFDENFLDKTFADFLQMRRRCITDAWWFLVEVMEMDLVECAHRDLVNHLVKWDNVGLKRNYTRKEFHSHLLSLDEYHRRPCCMPRSFFKSTTIQRDLVRAQLALPDLTTLIITATHPLAKKFTKTVRNFFVASGTKTLLHQLYPEFTIEDTEGSELEFFNPVARFALADPSIRASSMGATGAGAHVLYQIFDDAADEENSSTAELRESLGQKNDAVCELLDAPYGFVQWVGTRYAGGNVGADDGSFPDVYGLLLDREEKSEEKTLKILIKGAWTVKPHAQFKTIPELLEDDVDLLWPRQSDGIPTKGEWRVLKEKRDKNLQSFMQQQLNIPCGFETEKLRPFDMATLERCLCDDFDIPGWSETYAFWDLGGSKEHSDFSCGITVSRSKDQTGLTHLWIKNVKFLKLKYPDLAIEIAMQYRESGESLRCVAIEKPTGDHELFEEKVQDAARVRCSRPVPIKWIPTSNEKNVKLQKIKNLQLLMGQTVQIHFLKNQPWQKLAFQQMCNYKGGKSGTNDHLKDDFPDVLGLANECLMEQTEKPNTQESHRQKSHAEQVAELKSQWELDAGKRAREGWHSVMFGSNAQPAEPTQEAPAPVNPYHARIQKILGPQFR